MCVWMVTRQPYFKVDAARLQAVLGLPLSYLDVEAKYKKHEVDDLIEYLETEWCAAVMHEKFAAMRASVTDMIAADKAADPDTPLGKVASGRYLSIHHHPHHVILVVV